MMPEGQPMPVYSAYLDPALAEDLPPPPGQMPVVSAALAIGVLLLGVQLWLLTVALELYLAVHGERIGLLAVMSGAIFLGGLAVLWFLRRRPRLRQPRPVEAPE